MTYVITIYLSIVTLDGDVIGDVIDVIVHKIAKCYPSSDLIFCLSLLHKINQLFSCKLIVIILIPGI